ncbi:uncharacterized protein LOC106720236 [Papilio machaon]|uniref:uncharacterized protein LOC106720236 n=1 Tax=Papilio machaon TaxID=76193 RepID=UPI001E664EA1|nr:uncharacterized protein LOC106720236 [Papilio machaon]
MVTLQMYTAVLLMILQKAVNSLECIDFYTIFEEKSCYANHTFNPGIDPATFKTLSKHEIPDDCTDTLPQEDCFLQLTCDVIETSCESITTSTMKTTETIIHETEATLNYTTVTEYTKYTESTPTEEYTTSKEYTLTEEFTPTTEYREEETDATKDITVTYQTEKWAIEEREFYTAFEETTCNDLGPIIIINPVPMYKYLKSWNTSSFTDNDCAKVYPLDTYLELSCEDIVTSCKKIEATGILKSSPSTTLNTDNTLLTATHVLIAIGSVASVTLVSYAGYCISQKIIDIIQSNTYHLPQ